MRQEEIERIKRMQSEAVRETLCDRIEIEKTDQKEDQ
jgi:hypothetical protein